MDNVNGIQTVDGTGDIVMSDNDNNQIFGAGFNTVTVDAGVTIRGAGSVGLNADIHNSGGFVAEGATAQMLLRANTYVNDGEFCAVGAGVLEFRERMSRTIRVPTSIVGPPAQ
jgi:hypothetical protein